MVYCCSMIDIELCADFRWCLLTVSADIAQSIWCIQHALDYTIYWRGGAFDVTHEVTVNSCVTHANFWNINNGEESFCSCSNLSIGQIVFSYYVILIHLHWYMYACINCVSQATSIKNCEWYDNCPFSSDVYLNAQDINCTAYSTCILQCIYEIGLFSFFCLLRYSRVPWPTWERAFIILFHWTKLLW